MKSSSVLAVMLVVGAVVACGDAASPVSPVRPNTGSRLANNVVNETTPSGLVITNPCNGDVVTLTGTMHTVLNSTQSGSGNYHIYLDVSNSYTGEGAPSLASYQGSNTFHDENTVANPLPFEETFIQTVSLRSAGNEDNFTLRLQVHITINSQGVLTSDVSNPSTTCNG